MWCKIKELIFSGKARNAVPSFDLKQTAVLFNVIFDNASDGWLLVDAETHAFVMANKVFCRMVGYSKEELLKMSVKDLHPPTAIPHIVATMQAQAKGERYVAASVPVNRQDGSSFFADLRVYSVMLAGRRYLLVDFIYVNDFGEPNSGVSLASSLRAYLATYTNDIVFILDENLHFIDMNVKAASYYGYSREELLNMSAPDISVKESTQDFTKLVEDVKRSKEISFELQHRRKDKTTFLAETVVHYIEVCGQRLYQAIVHDITSYRAIQRDLEKANEELRSRVAELELFDKISMDREKRILELKDEITALKEELARAKGS